MVVAVENAEQSLHNVALRLRAVGRDNDADFVQAAQGVVRQATLAVERELVLVAGQGGLRPRISWDQPRLIPRLERLEHDLSATLVALWTLRVLPTTSRPPSLHEMAAQLSGLADQIFDLVHESSLDTGALD